LTVLFNLLPVSRGQTVVNEVLGSGTPLIAGQDLTLQNSPVTYLMGGSTWGDNYRSTVRVWVNGQEWAEVRSFYGQLPGARIFVTREDEQGKTHVVFGDGQSGALLPTGINNVVASYRYGSGAAVPAAGSLTVVLKPVPGLRAVHNPVAVGGGADPDPPDKVRRLAPQSVLTFNRAVSLDDFQTIAAQTPGVVRARAAVSFDPLAQRPRITVWVGDDPSTVSAVQSAFAATADPNRQPRVALAQAVVMTLSLTVVTERTYQKDAVLNAVHAALLDPDVGLFGVNVVQIGEVFYDSQVYAACLAVHGVVAVHSLSFAPTPRYRPLAFASRFRFIRGGPILEPVTVAPSGCCGQRHDPGDGGYLLLPDNADHFTLAQENSS
jgi:predicted phage baseplate assembly protein